MVGRVDSILELSLNNESPQPLFVTVMCIEKTGKDYHKCIYFVLVVLYLNFAEFFLQFASKITN